MMKTTKNQCINVSTESYTGKEQSPKRFGLSAEGFDINYEKEGFDKLIWIVQMKNNRKVWIRKNNNITITHEEPVIQDTIPKSDIDNNDTIDSNDSNDTIDSNDAINNSNDGININDGIDAININNDTNQETESSSNTKQDKKKTDYNIFLKYYLNKLKNEEQYLSTPHKIIFQLTTQEWARLKKNPTELKTLIEKIKN